MKTRYFLSSICLLLLSVLHVTAQTTNTLSIPDVSVAAGKTIAMPINVDNTTDIVAVQFTLVVPEGVSLDTRNIKLSERSNGHTAILKQLETRKYMAMVFSPNNKALQGRTGELLSVPLSASAGMAEGSTHSFTLTDVVIADDKGNNMTTGFSTGKLTIAKQPDLEISQVTSPNQSITPGGKITASWQVRNIGGTATGTGWSEQIFLDGNNGTSKLLGIAYYQEALPAGGTIARSTDLEIPTLLGIDQEATLRVKVVPNHETGEPAGLNGNNTASSNTTISIGKLLQLQPNPIIVEEAGESSVRLYLTRSGNTENTEKFTLETTSDNRITFPTDITIDKGQSGSYFYAQVTANNIPDKDSLIQISISGNGYPMLQEVLTIKDDIHPALNINSEAQDITEGGSINLTISTENAPSKDTPIQLTCDGANRFIIPADIVIPAGKNSVTISVEAKEDNIPNVEQVITFTASAVNYSPGSMNTVLLDNDIPTLEMELTPAAVSEGAGPICVLAKLRRKDNIDKNVTIKFSDDSNNSIYYAQSSVEMKAGVEEISVNLGPIDNALVDGERTYNISAAVYIASCSCSASQESSGGLVSRTLTVYDNDGATLAMSSSSSVLKEGGEITVTIERNTATDNPINVTLNSTHHDALEFPNSIVIPSGKKSESFTVKSKSNTASGDDFTASITAESEGFAKGSIWFSVSDQTLPDAQITQASVTANEAEVNSTTTFIFTLTNSGLSELPAMTECGIYQAGTVSRIASAYLQQPLRAGESVVLQKDITLPENIGEYKLYVTANPDKKVKELLYNNNASAMISVKTAAPYTTTVMVEKDKYNQGESINIKGNIQGKDVGNKAVEIYIINAGYRHSIQTVSDEQGAFQTAYSPYDGQMGHFAVGACYPNEQATTEMASFQIYGIKRSSNQAITHEILLEESQQGSFTIVNPTGMDLTGMDVEIISKPENCDLKVVCPEKISANAQAQVEYTLTANATSPGTDWERIELKVKSNEGASLPVTLYYYCRNKSGQLQASVTRISTTMTKDSSRDYPFTITNIGKGETGKISLALPTWMSSATPKEIPSLEANASATVILRLNPTEDMQLNVPITGNIGINCENGNGLSIPYSVEPVSESKGTLTIDVCDEYTYYTQEAPHVAGAEVIISHPTTGILVTQGKTGEDGKFSAELPEGYYAVKVTAPKHESYQNNILVDPERERKVTVNLGFNAITYDFKVEETEIEDLYTIVSNVKYETNVPVPVVLMDLPDRIDGDNMAIGESTVINVTLTNKGLITAQNVNLLLPTDCDEWEFEALGMNEAFSLAAQQSVTIPVKITRVETVRYAPGINRAARANNTFQNCMVAMKSEYEYLCGDELKNNEAAERMIMKACGTAATIGAISDAISSLIPNISGPVPGSPAPQRPNKPGSGSNKPYKPTQDPNTVTESNVSICDPCEAEKAEDMINFMLSKIPIVGTINDAMDIAARSVQDGRNEEGTIQQRMTMTRSAFIRFCEWIDEQNEELRRQREAEEAFGEFGGEVFGYLQDISEIIEITSRPCPPEDEDQETPQRRVSARSSSKSWMDEYNQKANTYLEYINNLKQVYTEYFGDPIWCSGDLKQKIAFFNTLQNNEDLTEEEIMALKPEDVSEEQVRNILERIENFAQNSDTENTINLDAIEEIVNNSKAMDSKAIANGYQSVGDEFIKAYDKALTEIEAISQSVCSSITLQFSQSMVMTRQAFRGTLTVFNGHENTAMENVRLYLEVKDLNGKLASSHEFQINPESLNGFTGNLNLTEGWSLDAGETGVATIVYIPTRYAAPNEDTKYSFGGVLSYLDPFTGLEVSRTLSPVILTVKPSPILNLTYFMQRDILGDDPLTEAVEPSEEAEFSVLINNIGYGDANNVQLNMAQPQITENEKGLLVNFELTSSQLNGGEKTLALGSTTATDFGSIPAKSQAYAQWWIKSSLLGHFTDYNIQTSHVSSYDNPDLSLLNEVSIHELIRSLEIQHTEESIVGFLTNDIVDANDTPDMLYLSNGSIESVAVASSAQILKNSDTEYTLTITPSKEGWNYGNIADPTYGVSMLKSIVRQSDGQEISIRNFWQTDRTLRDGKDPLYENRIHFTDFFKDGMTENYLLTFEPCPELTLEIASIEGIPTEETIVTEPVENITVMFNKFIQPSTFTSEDLTLNVQGIKQDANMISISTTDNKTFVLDMSEINKHCGNGYYTLSIQTAQIKDQEGFFGKEGKQVGWTMYRNGNIQIYGSVYPEAAGSIVYPDLNQIKYGEPLKLSATANNGYEFANWSVNDENISDQAEIELTALNDMKVVANFKKKLYPVQISSECEGGTIEGYYTGNYEYESILNLKALPYEDFIFEKWQVNGTDAGNSPTLEIKVEKELNITALFTRQIFQQNTTLYQGWNWISNYLHEAMPIELFNLNVSRIISQFEETVHDPVYGMVGNIDSLKPGAGYKIETPITFVKSFKGHLHNLKDQKINLKKGWNWISYPYFENRSFEVITNAEEGDVITTQNGFAEYAEGYWEGTSNAFTPSNGYLYKSNSDKSLIFDFEHKVTTVKNVKRNVPVSEDELFINIHQYPNTMNIIGKLYQNDQDITDKHFTIYAMVEDEVRGISQYINGKYYLTVYGDEPVNISLIVKDQETEEVFIANEILSFHSDIIGNRQDPYKINIGQTTDIETFNKKDHEKDVYSLSGILLQKHATEKDIKRLSPGVYIIDGQKYIVK